MALYIFHPFLIQTYIIVLLLFLNNSEQLYIDFGFV